MRVLDKVLKETSKTDYYERGNPFDWERTWGIGSLALIVCCSFEYKLFEDERPYNK